MTYEHITEAEIARVRRRHDGIEQDGLFDTPDMSSGTNEKPRSKPLKIIRWAMCPHHVPSSRRRPATGLVQDGERLYFREHTKWVGKHRVPCPGSGLEYVE